jgi:hypothetical protein
MSKKFKFSIKGTEFQLPISQVQVDTYSDTKEKYIYMNAKSAASVIKQYVKKNYPNLKVWSKSSVYSGGSSVDVDVCNPDGSSISDYDVFEDIKQWSYILKAGTFNGMIDMYEDREDSPSTDAGTPMKYFPSYIFINNKPQWGTVEYWVNQYNEYKANINNPDYSKQTEIMNEKYNGSFLEMNKTYMTKKEYERCSLVLS